MTTVPRRAQASTQVIRSVIQSEVNLAPGCRVLLEDLREGDLVQVDEGADAIIVAFVALDCTFHPACIVTDDGLTCKIPSGQDFVIMLKADYVRSQLLHSENSVHNLLS